MKEIRDIWFKQNSPARDWLTKNIDLDKSFSKTFRTTGGTFKFYEYEYVLRRCIINNCNLASSGSFSTNGGVRLNFCENHINQLVMLQNPPHLNVTFFPIMKFAIPNILMFLLTNPVITALNRLEVLFHTLVNT